MPPLNPKAEAWAPPGARLAHLSVVAPLQTGNTDAGRNGDKNARVDIDYVATRGITVTRRPSAGTSAASMPPSTLRTAPPAEPTSSPKTPSSAGGDEDFTFDDVFERGRSVASASTSSPRSAPPFSPSSFTSRSISDPAGGAQTATSGARDASSSPTAPRAALRAGAPPGLASPPAAPSCAPVTRWQPSSPTITSVAPTRAARQAAAELMADETPGAGVTGTDAIIAEADAIAAAERDPQLAADAVAAAGVAAAAAAARAAPTITVHVPTPAAEAAARAATATSLGGVTASLGPNGPSPSGEGHPQVAAGTPPNPSLAAGSPLLAPLNPPGSPSAAPVNSALRPPGPADFELLRVVGQGAFGKVFQVRKRDTHEVFAMKVMRKDRIRARDHHEYVRAERDVLTAIVHPYVVTLRFSFQTSKKLYLVLDFVNGGHLFFQLYRAGTFEEARARLYTAEIVLAITHLHERGFVHRDLKPENVLMDVDGHVRVTDFGLAKVGACDDASARSNSFIGTLEYMAPEIVTGKGHGKAVDWWSVGILLYEMLCGVAPFRAKAKNALQKAIVSAKPKLPAYLSAQASSLVRALLQKDPAKRLGFGPSGSAEVMNHPFFRTISWTKLEAREIPAPFRPSVASVESVENFDRIWTDLPPDDSPAGTPRDDAPLRDDDGLFEGFTYVAPPSILTSVPKAKDARAA